MLCMWCCVPMVLCTRCVRSVMYMWYCVQIVHVALYTCGTMLCVLCSRCIVTSVFIVFYSVYIYIFCCTLGVGVCIMFYTRCKSIYCVVVYTGLRCVCHVVHWV